ncbi:hypothetical protein [Actinoplanes sp. NPDC049118]|uniref:hypothetical protein n=1 Tax=Actinoplanes sp. NPDC049118 TaxID=3155769 RepID=UPI0033EDDE06
MVLSFYGSFGGPGYGVVDHHRHRDWKAVMHSRSTRLFGTFLAVLAGGATVVFGSPALAVPSPPPVTSGYFGQTPLYPGQTVRYTLGACTGRLSYKWGLSRLVAKTTATASPVSGCRNTRVQMLYNTPDDGLRWSEPGTSTNSNPAYSRVTGYTAPQQVVVTITDNTGASGTFWGTNPY